MLPCRVAKGPAVLPADGTSALHPIHRRLLPLRPDSHRPLLHPLLPGDRPGLLVHGAHPPAMAAVDVGTAGLLPAFIHHHHSIFQQYLVHHSHLYPDTYRLGYPLRLHPAIPHPGHYPGLLATAPGRRTHRRKSGNKPRRRKGRAASLREQLQEAIVQRKLYLNPGLTIIDLACECGTNRTQLSLLLNKELGLSFRDYINHCRIQYAALPLLEDEEAGHKIEEVALLSGFGSTATFYRAFAKEKGMAPQQWQESIRKSRTRGKTTVYGK